MRSILGQGFQDWQLVVVNDAGDRQVADQVLARYAPEMRGRCRLLHREVSLGIEAAANYGVAHCDGRYVVLHDDDDSWHPQFLERMVGYLRTADASVRGVFAGTQQIVERIEGNAIREIGRRNLAPPEEPLTVAALRRRNPFPPISFLYEREAGQSIGGYREDLQALGDWEFNVRFLSRFKIGYLPKISAYWHHRPRAGFSTYANSPYRDHMVCLMRLKREWGQWPPLWRYLMWWRY